MNISFIHDLNPSQLNNNFASTIYGFFLGTFWYINRPSAHAFVNSVSKKGGIKKAYGIPNNALYIQGADRPVQSSTSSLLPERVFLRPPIFELREAVALKPDVIQVHDLPLESKDEESRIVQKLTVNRDIVQEYHEWLVKNGFRSKRRSKDGLPKHSRFMLLGVVHGDAPGAYAEEAKFMASFCEVIGIPVAGLAVQRKYKYIRDVLRRVLEEIGDSRVVQLMGFGMSRIGELREVVALAKKYDAFLWLEGSTIIRNSIARRVLSLNPKSGKPSYTNIMRVKKADHFSPLDCFRYNDKTIRGLITQLCIKV